MYSLQCIFLFFFKVNSGECVLKAKRLFFWVSGMWLSGMQVLCVHWGEWGKNSCAPPCVAGHILAHMMGKEGADLILAPCLGVFPPACWPELSG